MNNRNRLQGEQLAEKIIMTVKINLADFDGKQLDQLVAILEGEIRERDILGNLIDYNKGEITNDSLGHDIE